MEHFSRYIIILFIGFCNGVRYSNGEHISNPCPSSIQSNAKMVESIDQLTRILNQTYFLYQQNSAHSSRQSTPLEVVSSYPGDTVESVQLGRQIKGNICINLRSLPRFPQGNYIEFVLHLFYVILYQKVSKSLLPMLYNYVKKKHLNIEISQPI